MSDHRARLRALERDYPPPGPLPTGPYEKAEPPPEWWEAFAARWAELNDETRFREMVGRFSHADPVSEDDD